MTMTFEEAMAIVLGEKKESPTKCPKCGSPDPSCHPMKADRSFYSDLTMDVGIGTIQICNDPFHGELK